jgi:hypothetical protein
MSGARLLSLSLLLLAACPAASTTSAAGTVRIHVRPRGSIEKVVLWDAGKGFEAEQKAGETVTFEAPRDRLDAPRLTVVSTDGAETVSAQLTIAPLASDLDVGTLGVWPASVAFQREGERLRFSWPPLAVEGAPESVHYSLLFIYRNAAGQEAEGSLIARSGCEAIQTLSDLSDIFPDRDPAAKTMELRIRAHAGGVQSLGTIWAGKKQTWTVPEDLPAPNPGGSGGRVASPTREAR